MGVMACNRNGCDNIMCDRYSQKYGYICGQCFEELVTKYTTGCLSEFMESDKNETLNLDCNRYILEKIFIFK